MALKYFGLGVNSIVVTTQSYKQYNIQGHADSHSVSSLHSTDTYRLHMKLFSAPKTKHKVD